MKDQSNIQSSLSRRRFLKLSGGFSIGVTVIGLVPQLTSCTTDGEDTRELVAKELNAWVNLQEDGQITIMSPASEMGQGSRTSLPLILAEELDADWSKIQIETSPIDPEIYGSPGFGGPNARKIMLNVGSRTVKGYFKSLRQAGAQTRYVLLHSVSKAWEVPLEELSTEPSMVVHEASGRKIPYGEVVSILDIPETIPEIPEDKMKQPEDFRLIWNESIGRVDVAEKSNGQAQFSMDLKVPGMVYGVIERGKIHGASPSLRNEAAIRAEDGLIDLVALDYGIGVVANTLEKALEIKKNLDIDWNKNVPAARHSSQEALDQYATMTQHDETRELRSIGNVGQAMARAAKTYTADYKNDYVYHAQMEPLNAIASVSEEGASAEIWAGTQGPGFVAGAVADALSIEPEKVQLNLCYLGGGFGRRSMHDYIIEAALLSKAVKKPVKMIWAREDDVRYGMYRPMSLQRMQAGTDANGNIVAFSHSVTGDGSNLLASGTANEFYDIPNQEVRLNLVKNGIRLKHWRSVGHGPNKFAIEAFLDQIAADQGTDPLEMRRKLMANHPKALRTLEKAAEMANWNTPPPEGRARGIAFGERSGALCTGIAEISVNRETGKIKVHHFWSAVDGGIMVQPDNAKAQMEGGILMGMSSVLSEQLTIEQGEVQQSNFHDYNLLRIVDIPETLEIELLPSDEAPQGMGEASTPIVAGAIANAFLALTGKPLTHLPFTPERVKAVLES
jgi:isoquinoline 1-oxidoreductase beta subunit